MKLITQNQFSKVKIATLFVFAIIVAHANATSLNNQGSSFKLFLPYQAEHKIIIDNIPYFGVYDNFKIDNLYGGNHRLKIIQLIVSRNGRLLEKLTIFNGAVFIPNNSKVWASISQNGRLNIERTYFNNNRGNNNCQRDNYRNHENYNDCESDNYNSQQSNDYDDGDWYSDRNTQENANRNKPSRTNINNRSLENELSSFELTLNALKKQSFDTERLKIAKNAVVSGEMLSKEILEITKLFSFESTRVEFAKYAYSYTVDKKNYVLVQDAFQFNSSTSELQDFIAKYGH